MMRVLLISSLFPPSIMGGAELAAHSLAVWLARAGHNVHVLTGSPQPEGAGISTDEAGFTIERRFFPNLYSIYQAGETRLLRKLLWHARDHFHHTAEQIVREAIERFRPDIVNTHDLQGIGYNLLREIGRQRLPCVQTLHDLGFLCVNMNMFKDGKACPRRHLPCAVSGFVKSGYLSSIDPLAFWSPSQALLERYRPHLPRHREAVCIQLPLIFSPPPEAVEPKAGSRLRLLYVGQFTEAKGVEFLLSMLEPLAAEGGLELIMVGSGALLQPLRERYARAAWVKFTGRVPSEEVGQFMARSDALMLPSLWFENSPLVAYQAKQLGLPILASRIGGIPELVREGVNGQLLPLGDTARWQKAVRNLLAQPEGLERLRAGAKEDAHTCDPDVLGNEVVRLFQRTIGAVTPPKEAAAV